VYGLHKQLGDVIGGAAPVIHVDGYYLLNHAAGVETDIACFEALASASDCQAREGNVEGAAELCARALRLYCGDLCTSEGTHAMIEREQLRARFLTILARLADYFYNRCDYASCLEYALRLLTGDPFREDAHRVLMRCYVRRGERAQALRQYRICEQVLRAEFDAIPEQETTALFDKVRTHPDSI
jgi:DNA-binding SARP family transcriptional activator